MYAVIEIKGHQYIVTNGTEISVDRIDLVDVGSEYVVDNVYLSFDDKGTNVLVGKPNLSGAKVVFDVLSQNKDDKINVLKFKRKNRYERHIGFRAKKTLLKVKDILLDV